jgi:DNA-binding MarR family transcriptional regulator
MLRQKAGSVSAGIATRAETFDQEPVSPRRKAGLQDRFVPHLFCVTIQRKYVNMTDINVWPGPARSGDAKSGKPTPAEPPVWDVIELIFFAYRDFVGDPDSVLAAFGFGRAHHRVLHFVNRNPGLKVAELLDILKITKQSLGRVLKQLIDQGYVEQREGEKDRRQRLLFVTPKGEALALKLADLQTQRIGRAFAELGPDAPAIVRRFLAAMLDPEARRNTVAFIADADHGPWPGR